MCTQPWLGESPIASPSAAKVNAAIRSLSRPRPRPETGVQLSSDLGIMEGAESAGGATGWKVGTPWVQNMVFLGLLKVIWYVFPMENPPWLGNRWSEYLNDFLLGHPLSKSKFLKMDSDSFEASNSQIWDISRIEPAISRWCRLGGSSFQCRCPRYNPPRWVHPDSVGGWTSMDYPVVRLLRSWTDIDFLFSLWNGELRMELRMEFRKHMIAGCMNRFYHIFSGYPRSHMKVSENRGPLLVLVHLILGLLYPWNKIHHPAIRVIAVVIACNYPCMEIPM